MRYAVSTSTESFRIFPKGQDGKTRPVNIVRTFITLVANTGDEVVFKRYLHRKQWYWADSRMRGPVSEHHVLSEIARMAYGGDQTAAASLIVKALIG